MRRYALLIGVGLTSEAVYAGITARLPWWRYGGTLNSWHQILGQGWGPFAACLVGIGVLFVSYGAGWYAIRKAPTGSGVKQIVWGFSILFGVTAFWLLPITSDLFTYLSQAHLFTDLRVNPLAVAPLSSSQLSADQLLLAYPALYSFRPSVYGPAWLLLSVPGTVGRYDVAMGLFYLKGLAVVSYWGCAWLLTRIIRQGHEQAVWSAEHGGGPSSVEAVYLFAWNPLVLLMTVGDGHNDIVMMAGVLLAIWLLLKERWVPALAVLALSAWIKYVSAILVPLFVLYIWEQIGSGSVRSGRVRLTLAQGVAAIVGVSALVLVPFGRPDWLVALAGRLLQPVNWGRGVSGMPMWVMGGGLLLFAVLYLALVAPLSQYPSRQTSRGARGESASLFQKVVEICFLVLLSAFVLGAVRAQPWYLLWPASLAGLSGLWVRVGSRRIRWAWPVVIGLSAAMLAGQIWVEWGAPGVSVLF